MTTNPSQITIAINGKVAAVHGLPFLDAIAAERDRLREALVAVVGLIDFAMTDDSCFKGDNREEWETVAEPLCRVALANTTPPAPDPLRDAAPELLAVLKEALMNMEGSRRHNCPPDTYMIVAAQKAIAKAEGR